jgi:OmcA/MtrC family decaheme c-type cytochrome
MPVNYFSPFITASTAYGLGYQTDFKPAPTLIDPATALPANYVNAAGTTLINSPITSACSACHDSAAAIAHFKGNGGAFYEPRATGLLKVEQCMVCHGSGRTADIKAVHMTFK